MEKFNTSFVGELLRSTEATVQCSGCYIRKTLGIQLPESTNVIFVIIKETLFSMTKL